MVTSEVTVTIKFGQNLNKLAIDNRINTDVGAFHFCEISQ